MAHCICKGEIGNLQYLFFAVCVFLINFNFSSPRIPKIATLLYFWVFVVKVKIENSIKSTARCVHMPVRYASAVLRSYKIYSKILAGLGCTIWLYISWVKILFRVSIVSFLGYNSNTVLQSNIALSISFIRI